MGKFCHGISSGGGGGGGRLPYGIPSWGTFAIWYNLPRYLFPHHEMCVGDDINVCTIEGEALPYDIVPLVLAWNVFRGKVCHMVFIQGERLPYGIVSGGGGGFPCDTGAVR